MKPSEPKDLSDVLPASSEVQPDHCRKDVQKVGKKGAAHGGKKNSEEERVVPSGSYPDALQMKREWEAEDGHPTLFSHFGRRKTSRMGKKKRNPASKESRRLCEKAQGQSLH